MRWFCRLGNVLRENGISKGDRICIYMPMIPELAVAVLACAHIGAIHSVVFAGFLRSRWPTASRFRCKMVLCSDGGYRAAAGDQHQGNCRWGIRHCPSVEKVIIKRRTGTHFHFHEGTDIWWDEAVFLRCLRLRTGINGQRIRSLFYIPAAPPETQRVVHTCGGYMVYAAFSFLHVFQYQPGDIFWCTGWHWLGNRTFVYCLWPIAERRHVGDVWRRAHLSGCRKILAGGGEIKSEYIYTAPTAIRSLMVYGDGFIEPIDLSSLKNWAALANRSMKKHGTGISI